MYIGNTPPANYTYAQLAKVLEHNRGIAQLKGSEVQVEQDFSSHLQAEQAAPKEEGLKLSLGFAAEA
ncbi:hypothetical protein [Pseudomonas sp. PH1b]|uniref:hypothetical protein n=1 Tax=Pseudomonas sp. PH1b TaxID=1397282 RepID=UPI0004683E3F|nr:hypothetical protein [Pseudomonas sp. PH1b]